MVEESIDPTIFLCVLYFLDLRCWGGRMVQATACRAVIYGFNSHPQLQNSSSFSATNFIFLKGKTTNPKEIDIYRNRNNQMWEVVKSQRSFRAQNFVFGDYAN